MQNRIAETTRLDWNDFRFALAVARKGSLSGAAEALGVHQTTCGRRLSALEESLGFPLFLRTASGLHPTLAGERVLGTLDELAISLTRFEQDVRVGEEGMRGLVRIAVTATTAQNLIEDAIPELLAEHPNLAIELVSGNTATDLMQGDAEIAVRLTAPEPGLVARRIGFIRYGLYAAESYLKQHRASLDPPLAKHRVLVPSRELSKGPEANWIAQFAKDARRALYASSLPTIALAVARGIGMCPLPTVVGELHALTLVRLLPEIPPRPVWLVMHPDVRKLPRVRVVADAVAASVKKSLA